MKLSIKLRVFSDRLLVSSHGGRGLGAPCGLMGREGVGISGVGGNSAAAGGGGNSGGVGGGGINSGGVFNLYEPPFTP